MWRKKSSPDVWIYPSSKTKRNLRTSPTQIKESLIANVVVLVEKHSSKPTSVAEPKISEKFVYRLIGWSSSELRLRCGQMENLNRNLLELQNKEKINWTSKFCLWTVSYCVVELKDRLWLWHMKETAMKTFSCGLDVILNRKRSAAMCYDSLIDIEKQSNLAKTFHRGVKSVTGNDET